MDSGATSALDLAAWDLRARALGLPLHEALGGRVRDAIRVYVTSVDPDHLPPRGAQPHERVAADDWGLGGTRESAHRDWTASLERPAELARELVDEGFTALKLFPFVRLAEATGGLSITPAQLAENLEPFRAVREAVGDRPRPGRRPGQHVDAGPGTADRARPVANSSSCGSRIRCASRRWTRSGA